MYDEAPSNFLLSFGKLQALDEMGDINIQGIFDDKCQEKLARSSVSPLRRRVLRSVGKPMTTVPDPPKPGIDTLDPCISKESTAYLSREDVQNALHANTSGMLDWKYDGCAPQDRLNYSNIDQLSSQIPRLKKIMKHHPELRILYYSGDTDAMVPLTGTRRWTYKLGLELHKERKVRWTAWTGEDGQVGGWLEQYRHFTYLTIRHASHEAPYTQKGRTAYVYRTWLSGKVLV